MNTPESWKTCGLSLEPDGIVVVENNDCTILRFSPSYIADNLAHVEHLKNKIAELELRLKYAEPVKWVPEMIALLDRKAENADSAALYGQAAAYSDAARMLRRALK